MRTVLLLTALALLFAFSSVALADLDVGVVDGQPSFAQTVDLPGKTEMDGHGRTVDIVGDTSSSNTLSGRAKGNAYRIDTSVTLDEVEFWLNFTSQQTLTYYVFVSPSEFGTYNEVYRDSEVVAGMGAAWYSSGLVSVPLVAGNHYIIAVSWNGSLTYYYGIGDSQATSFGAHVHGYALGYDPLPSSFQSNANDQAIYHQRLMTTTVTGVEESTWGKVKALYR